MLDALVRKTDVIRRQLGSAGQVIEDRITKKLERNGIGKLCEARPDHLYESLLTVLLRLVFVLFAEDRNLLPSLQTEKAKRVYEASYALRSLYAKLLEDHALNPGTMDERRGGWGQLLALFRLIHGGHSSGFIQRRGGKLFDPDAFPFLEGRETPADPPMVLPVSDGCVLRILEGLMTIGGTKGRARERLSKLRGQSTPALSRTILDMSRLDWPLLDALHRRWQACFSTDDPDTKDLQLFRSLNMANAAAQLPAGADATNLDIGRSLALWSSAFEILAPGRSEAFRNVYALLDKITWNYSRCKETVYEAYGFKKDQTKRNLPSWLFGEINRARNDFLHGNPITDTRLIVAPAKRPLHLYASLLYRMALAAFLDLKYVPSPRKEGETEYEAYIRDDFAFGRFQGDVEVALSTIMMTEREQREEREARGARVRSRWRRGST